MVRSVSIFMILLAALLIHGCTNRASDGLARVTIAGKVFRLEVAADEAAQDKGLGGRTHLAPDSGMIFVFPEPLWHEFVMRDCVIPLDLLYVDDNGRIISMHAMLPEPPRTPAERADHPAEDFAYTARLTPYPSGAPCPFVIEIAGGSIEALGVKVGDRVTMDAAGLRTRLSE